jgi:hypothetical protein
MEMSQENSLCSYLKQTKMSYFFFFSFTKSETKRTEQVLPEGVGTSRRERMWEEGVGG